MKRGILRYDAFIPHPLTPSPLGEGGEHPASIDEKQEAPNPEGVTQL